MCRFSWAIGVQPGFFGLRGVGLELGGYLGKLDAPLFADWW